MALARKLENQSQTIDIKEVICSTKALGWEWFTTEIEDENYRFGLVQSPICPEGEFGSFYLPEIREIGGNVLIETNVRACLPPSGWEWVSPNEEEKNVDS